MALKVHRFWDKPEFRELSSTAKLVYIYLCTSPGINTLGLFTKPVAVLASIFDLDEAGFRLPCIELKASELVYFYGDGKNNVYFFVKGHFESLPNSEAVKKSAMKALKEVPDKVVDAMVSEGTMPTIERPDTFEPPTKEQVLEYAVSKGYMINPGDFINFYEERGWKDTRGKKVKDWRSKLRSVWFKDDRKIPKVKGAPKGFEHFYVVTDRGPVFPTSWSNGLPKGGSLPEDVVLQEEYNRLNELRKGS